MSLLSNIRAILTLGRGVVKGVTKLTAGDDPIIMFEGWFDDARQSGILLPDRVCLATATAEGVPSARMMLLKGIERLPAPASYGIKRASVKVDTVFELD